jgi:hypothetical protein
MIFSSLARTDVRRAASDPASELKIIYRVFQKELYNFESSMDFFLMGIR